MQRRPTIPLADWRIAIHLAATQSVQRQARNPAEGCNCKWCGNWRQMASLVLPTDLIKQIERLGVDVAYPTDLYAFQVLDHGAYCRVIYHVVGKLLSGPSTSVEDPALGRVLEYQELRAGSNLVMLAVFPCREGFDARPLLADESAGALLQIDLRLFVPLHSGPVYGLAQ